MAKQPTEQLVSILDRWQSKRVIVVGDFILDHYIYGNADRLSPDAPVPVLAVEKQTFTPGGASNVCLDLAALHCKVAAVGVVGRDDNAQILKQSLKDAGCQVSALVTDPARPTTVKHNFVGLAQHRHPQKMFRADEESQQPIAKAIEDKLIKKTKTLLTKTDVLCIQDQGKGVLTERLCQKLIELANKADIPVLVDPAPISDYSKYRGATCLMPNRTEATLATSKGKSTGAELSEDQIIAMGRTLMRNLKLNALVMTLDRQGAMLLQAGKKPSFQPTRARSVYDVTGAGDMVLAMIASATANGCAWTEAVKLANIAAGLEVEKFGVVPIKLEEILLELLREKHQHIGKLRNLEDLIPELDAHRQQGKTIVFTNGCFDILHAGHISFLRASRQQGDLLVVGLNTDDSIKRIKGEGRPVNHQADRVMVLSELESVDYIVLFEGDTAIKPIEAIKPDVWVKGKDYTRDQLYEADAVEAGGGKIVLVELVKGRSTTNIISKITNHSSK